MQDGARAVQFIRLGQGNGTSIRRLAVSGSSAGATLALWIALHDDLATLGKDPVSRLSTRVTCASPHSGPASLEPEYFRSMPVSLISVGYFPAIWRRFPEELQSPAKHALCAKLRRCSMPQPTTAPVPDLRG